MQSVLRSSALIYLVVAAGLVSIPFTALGQSAPTCDGQTATIWVQGGFIVGGDDNGESYSGTLNGTSGNDVIVGTSDDDVLDGKSGNDIICGLQGEDSIEGGFGDDRVFGDDGDDDLEGNDDQDIVCGGNGNDTIYGGIGNDTLCGDDGDDELQGSLGNDQLNGGDGLNDQLNGEGGNDICVNGESLDNCEDTTTPVSCPSGGGSGDNDDDGVLDTLDNCPLVPNANQLDTDLDGEGDVCDNDDDGDGVNDGADNCQLLPNADQTDTDDDGLGDMCDADTDSDDDGIPNASDNCDFVSNPNQLDTESDGQGDACDADDDGDSVADGSDNCPLNSNANQADTDQDGTGDACDTTNGGGDDDDDETESNVGGLSFSGLAGDLNSGSHRGSDSHVLRAALLAVFQRAQGLTGLPPAAFGGSGEALPTQYSQYMPGILPPAAHGGSLFTGDQLDTICTAQRMISRHIDRVRSVKYLSAVIRDLYDFNATMERAVRAALMNGGLCEPLLEVRLSQPSVAAAPVERQKISFAVDSEGVPVSSQPVWNQCIRGLTPVDESGNPFNCRRFQGFRTTWYHPDFPNQSVAFSWNPRDPRETSYPDYFVITQLDDSVALEDLLLAARAINRFL